MEALWITLTDYSHDCCIILAVDSQLKQSTEVENAVLQVLQLRLDVLEHLRFSKDSNLYMNGQTFSTAMSTLKQSLLQQWMIRSMRFCSYILRKLGL